MSRFLDRLDRIHRGATTSLGFGASARAEKLPSMALVGMLSKQGKSLKGVTNLVSIGADGALVYGMDIDDAHKALAPTIENVPWGIVVSELVGEQAKTYRGKGCDFLAFRPENALLGALEDEDTAYFLCIEPDMDEQSLRAIEDLPIDVVLLTLRSADSPLTIKHLITISSVRSAFSKYLLLEVSGSLTTGEMHVLRDIGVDGLVVDASALSGKELTGLKQRLLALPRRQRNKSTRPSAVLPRAAYALPGAPSDDEEDEEI